MLPTCWCSVLLYRLLKLQEMIGVLDSYATLGLSHIEGIEAFHNRFNLAVTTLRKKPYDILDQRKSDFDFDFDEFKRQVRELTVSKD